MASVLKFVPLGAFGVVVDGLNIRSPASGETVRELKQALAKFQLLLFRGQAISSQDHLRLTRYFGDFAPGIARRPADHRVDGFPALLDVRNTPDSPTLNYGFGWHSDGLAYARRPHGATLLHCIECPPGVGATMFASQYDAYETMPTDTREALAGRFWYLPPLAHTETPPGRGLIQPFVRTHPITQRTYVSFAPQATTIRGMTCDESEHLLRVVRRAQIHEDLVYSHYWEPGDLIVWENCALLHRRADTVDVASRGLRKMHRSATAGDFEAHECGAPQDSSTI